ncbi:NACHT, LRR and PYD domains-containing protein 14 [Balaenoptera acutorostrata]|uniref:NACHT, LRR and PYD domains-containing protein 14 n=1 Tax=Balaenoptera acutorostrata TaxID=9767 RepID=A0ABM3U4I0_BALAC|nr:NACHT, LRR and PYD domains-containing protein 14 [Balaenoptera acutorostrata]
MLDKNHLLGESENFCHEIAQEGRELLERLFDEDVRTGSQPQTMLLQGAAGVGKTTLVRIMMLDWAQGNPYQQKFTYVFYLSAREINQLRERSFAQTISKDWPSTEGPIERILSQPSSLLFIIDSFDELNFAFEEPECVLCADWTPVHPVSFLMSSLLRKVKLPESSLLHCQCLRTMKLSVIVVFEKKMLNSSFPAETCNKRLTHLCLAGNVLGDSGVKLMSDALKHPPCTLQSLVIFNDNEDDEDDDINNCHLFCPYFVLGPAQNLFNLNRSTYWCQIGHLSSKCLTEQCSPLRTVDLNSGDLATKGTFFVVTSEGCSWHQVVFHTSSESEIKGFGI